MRLVQNVAFDLDGVLVDFLKIVNEELTERFGVTIQKRNNFRIHTSPTQLTDKQVWVAFKRAYARFAEIPVMPGAIELLTKLYEITGLPPLIVTARPHWAATETYALMDRHFKHIPYNLVLANGGGSKLTFLGDVDHFVDDRRRIAIELALAGKYVYVPKAHYNAMNFEMDNIEYINGVADLVPMAEELCKAVIRYA